jgi:hypothetical protein
MNVPNISTNPLSVPVFATAQSRQYIDPELQNEFCKWMVILLREKVFFVLHWILFALIEGFGLYMGLTCSQGLQADGTTRFIMSIIPMFYINLIGLVCLVPINGTKQQIHDVEERVNFLKFQMNNQFLLR